MSQILVDTSAWVEMFRKKDSPEVQKLGEWMRAGLVCVSGLILAEILSGAKSPKEYIRLEDSFSAFYYLQDPPSLWQRVARYRFRLAKRGFQASIADLIVATTASYHRRHLFTLDHAFRDIAKVIPLKLLELARH
ncbi:MAG: PIN domain-containing protein [Elusimicrobia bacterium]|nr:PIN domain-containing protein [Elusimicrobiota bacterium]